MKKILTYRSRGDLASRVMKVMLALILLASVATIYSCRKTDDLSPAAAQTNLQGTLGATSLIMATGLLKESGVTTYQYGQYILTVSDTKTSYALKSSALNLKAYVNKIVTVEGVSVRGYPIDGGPVYLDVVWIGESTTPPEMVTAAGTLIAVGSNTLQYAYGWQYKLINRDHGPDYYIKSSSVELEMFLNKPVRIQGLPESSIPVNVASNDSYLNVISIMEIAASSYTGTNN